MTSPLSRGICALGLLLLSWARAWAWDYEGHRAVNTLALEALPTDFPAFVHEPDAAERIAFLAGEPDRWRNVGEPTLRHVNGPDHYINFEALDPLDLTGDSVSDLRHIYTSQVFAARARHPERFPRIDDEKNEDHTRELPGYLPWSIVENYQKLRSAFSYLKTLEELGATTDVGNARENVLYYMGVLGHYVGDGAQPLHTTIAFNGWVGDNPEGFTTSRSIHAWIDGGFLQKTGGISFQSLVAGVKPAYRLTTTPSRNGRDPIFNQVMVYLNSQYEEVVPLYRLYQEGGFAADSGKSANGRTFIERQMCEAATMLGSLWMTAWLEAPPDTYLRSHLLKEKAGERKTKARARKTRS